LAQLVTEGSLHRHEQTINLRWLGNEATTHCSSAKSK
jgi:hypothetical protein